MDEQINILDSLGNQTNKTTLKSIAHKEGLWHKSIHILIISKDKTKILLQKRCSNKSFFPNMWDISVGGHVSLNEDPYTSAKRELFEELGIENNNLKEIKTIKESLKNNNIISNEFVTIFILEEDINIKDITLQKEEVSAIKWVNKRKLNELIKNKKIIPHTEEYALLNEILI